MIGLALLNEMHIPVLFALPLIKHIELSVRDLDQLDACLCHENHGFAAA